MDGFSCHDAHAFNRNSSSQVAPSVGSSCFPRVTRAFTFRFSPLVLSSHAASRPVLFRFVAHIFLTPLKQNFRSVMTLSIRPRNKAEPQRSASRLRVAQKNPTPRVRFRVQRQPPGTIQSERASPLPGDRSHRWQYQAASPALQALCRHVRPANFCSKEHNPTSCVQRKSFSA